VNKSGANTTSAHIPYIDGLRGIAVLAVIIYHLNSNWLPGGFTGVDIFFTISGFVVSLSIAKKQRLNPVAFISTFYARRILRIIPPLLVCLILTGLAVVLFIPYAALSSGIEVTMKYAFFGISNLVLMKSSDDYFGPMSEFNPFTHTWSLGIEEQFYLIFPILFYWWTITNKNSRSRYISTSLFSLLFVLSITYAWWSSSTSPAVAFYSVSSRFWELASGVILYQITASRYEQSEIDSQPHSLLGISISITSIVLGLLFARPDRFPLPWALLPVVGTIGSIFFLYGNKHNLIYSSLSNRFILFIGKISYSLYLWHWPVFVLFHWTVGLDSIPCYFGATVLSFLMAVLSYYSIEQFFRQSPLVHSFSKVKVISIGCIAIIISYYMSQQIFLHRLQLSLSVTAQASWNLPKIDPKSFNQSQPNCPIKVSKKDVMGAEIILFSRLNCQQKISQNQLFVVGDSHAKAYQPMIQKFSMETVTDTVVYTKPGCPYLDLLTPLNRPNCQQFYQYLTADILKNARQGDILFLPSLRLRRFGEQWKSIPAETAISAMSGTEALKQREDATTEAISLLKPFAARGLKVVLEAPKPIFKSPNFRCSDWFNRLNPICERGLEVPKEMLLNHRLPVMTSIQKISQEVDSISTWDPFPVLCPGDSCQANQDRKPLFSDGDHLSDYGNMFVYASFEKFIKGLMS
jgi:peptidoglycan/LPS O-acetylase OafA/YrhL